MRSNNRRNSEDLFSKRITAGDRTTYFFDVKEAKNGDFYVTVTESTRMREGEHGVSYKKNRIYLHRENFGRFARGLKEAMDFVKNKMDEVDFSEYEDEQIPPRLESDFDIDEDPNW